MTSFSDRPVLAVSDLYVCLVHNGNKLFNIPEGQRPQPLGSLECRQFLDRSLRMFSVQFSELLECAGVIVFL